MVGRTGVPRLVGWLFRLEWACPTPAGLPECAVTGEGACTVYRGLRAHTCSTPSRPWWVAIHVHRGRLSLARVGRTPAPTITYTITRTRAIHPDTKPRLVNGRARTRNRETEAACRRFAAPRASFRQILGYVHTGRALPSLPPSLHQLSIRPPTPSRPTPSDPDRLKWFVFDLTTTAAAVHGGTLFPPRTLPSFSVSRRMCGGVAPLPARYVCIYSFVDHLGTLARCTMQLRPRSFGVSSGGFGFLEDGTVERRKPAAMPLFAVAAWLYCRRHRS